MDVSDVAVRFGDRSDCLPDALSFVSVALAAQAAIRNDQREVIHRTRSPQADTVAEIAGFPFENFEQLQAAVAIRSFNVGVDPLAAAEWSGRLNSKSKKTIIAALSLLLVVAAAASIIAAFVTREYWLLLAPPIQAVAFYVSQPSITGFASG